MGHGCAPKKIEASPVLGTWKTRGTQHIISMENMRFSSHPRAKVGQQGPPGSAEDCPGGSLIFGMVQSGLSLYGSVWVIHMHLLHSTSFI